MTVYEPTLTQVEIDTILAALRLYQATPHLPNAIRAIAEANSASALCPEEVDDLCERLNFAPEVPAMAAEGV